MARLGGSASVEIDAPLERVWEEVQDVESTPEWQGGLDEMTVLERDDRGRPSLVRSETDAKVRRIKTVVRFRYDPPTRLSWSQQKGDLSKLDGAWLLEDLGSARTRATYTLDGDPARPGHARARTGAGQHPRDARRCAPRRAQAPRRGSLNREGGRPWASAWRTLRG